MVWCPNLVWPGFAAGQSRSRKLGTQSPLPSLDIQDTEHAALPCQIHEKSVYAVAAVNNACIHRSDCRCLALPHLISSRLLSIPCRVVFSYLSKQTFVHRLAHRNRTMADFSGALRSSYSSPLQKRIPSSVTVNLKSKLMGKSHKRSRVLCLIGPNKPVVRSFVGLVPERNIFGLASIYPMDYTPCNLS